MIVGHFLPFFLFCVFLLLLNCITRFLQFIFNRMLMIKPVYSWVRNWFFHFHRWTAKGQKVLPSTSLGEFNVLRVSVSDPLSSEVSVITFRNGWLVWQSPNPGDLWCGRYCLGGFDSPFTGSMVVPVCRKNKAGQRNYSIIVVILLHGQHSTCTTGMIFRPAQSL